MELQDWLTQSFLSALDEVETGYQDELAELQNDTSIKVSLHKSNAALMWLTDEVIEQYPKMTHEARNKLLPFPSSYLVECGFSAVTDILTRKRNRLDIFGRGDLRLKLTKMQPRIQALHDKHQSQGSH